jgi:Pectate lyase superfamily protein
MPTDPLAFSLLYTAQTLPNGTTGPQVWGTKGEKWNRAILLDWSWSGYGAKERPVPEPPVVANILDFGGKGDGVYDNIGPFAAALAKARSMGGGTVLIPAGRYLFSQRVVIDGDNIVLKGEGPQTTTLLFSQALSQLDNVDVSIFPDGSNPYSWLDGYVQIKGYDPGSTERINFVGAVTAPSEMGSRTLTLSTTTGLQVGQWIRLLMSDINGSLVKELYGSIVDRVGCGTDDLKTECVSGINDEQDLVRWAVRIASINGNEITLQRPLPVRVDPIWKPEIHRMPGSMIKESGIRDVSVEFPWTQAPPHLHELGYNAFYIDGAANAFIINVATLNADTSIMVANSAHVTVDGVTIGVTKPRGLSLPFDGHIGLGAYDSSDVEFANFRIKGQWTHDVTVRGTLMAVIHNGHGDNLNLDSHRSAPYATLYSNLHLGQGTRPYSTGGYLTRGFPAARFTTYYNLRSNSKNSMNLPAATMAGNCTWGANINAMGYWNDGSCPGYHVESYAYGSLQPFDLYGSMIDRKYSMRAAGLGATPLPEVVGPDLSGDGKEPVGGVGRASTDVPTPALAGDGMYPLITAPEIY